MLSPLNLTVPSVTGFLPKLGEWPSSCIGYDNEIPSATTLRDCGYMCRVDHQCEGFHYDGSGTCRRKTHMCDEPTHTDYTSALLYKGMSAYINNTQRIGHCCFIVMMQHQWTLLVVKVACTENVPEYCNCYVINWFLSIIQYNIVATGYRYLHTQINVTICLGYDPTECKPWCTTWEWLLSPVTIQTRHIISSSY